MAENVLVACGPPEHTWVPNAVETACACGALITHDPVMEANIRAEHPGCTITFECLACFAERGINREAVLDRTMGVLPPEVAALGKPDARAFADYLNKFRRN